MLNVEKKFIRLYNFWKDLAGHDFYVAILGPYSPTIRKNAHSLFLQIFFLIFRCIWNQHKFCLAKPYGSTTRSCVCMFFFFF